MDSDVRQWIKKKEAEGHSEYQIKQLLLNLGNSEEKVNRLFKKTEHNLDGSKAALVLSLLIGMVLSAGIFAAIIVLDSEEELDIETEAAVCSQLSVTEMRDQCYLRLAMRSREGKFCRGIETVGSADQCWQALAKRKKADGYCENVVDPAKKERCISSANR